MKPVLWQGALVFGVAVVLRGAGLAREPLTTNEATTAALAADPVRVAVYKTSLDVHPPLHYVFLNAWARAFGTSPISLRLPSVIAGSLTPLVVWWWARSAAGAAAALIAGLGVAISPFHVHYSQEARFYAFLGLAAALFCSAVARQLWQPCRRWWLLALATGLAGLYTHYYFGFLAVGVWAAAAVRAAGLGRRAWLKRWGLLAVGLTAGYGPWLPFLTRHVAGPGAGSTGPVTVGILQHTFRYFFSYGSDTQPWRMLSFLLLAVVLALGLVRWVWRKDHFELHPPLTRGPYLPVLAFLTTSVFVFAVCSLKPLYIAKGMVVVLPAYALLMGLTWQRLRLPSAKVAMGAVVVALCTRGLIEFYTVRRNTDWPAVADLLTAKGQAGDVVLLREGLLHVPLNYYYLPARPERRLPELQLNSHVQSIGEQIALADSASELAARLWLVRGHTADAALRDTLLIRTGRFACLERWALRGSEVLLFRVEPAGRTDARGTPPDGGGGTGA